MRIAQVAPPVESVPPSRYGGTETVVSLITEQLVQRGHEVTLFASGDSCTSARLVPCVDRAVWHHPAGYQDFAAFWPLILGKVIRNLDDFDVVHNHLDYAGFPLARLANRPVVTTLHGRLDLPELAPLYREFSDVPLVSISDAQRRPIPRANWMGTVHHGIDLEAYPFEPGPGRYLAFLGRISPEKGLDIAIRVARRAGLPLKIAARMPLPFKNDPNVRTDWEYYDTVVRPLLGEPGVEFVGEVGGAEKAEFLRNAIALLFPVQWPEPFGLVMVEALACGTPVLALRNGSVPEVVEDRVSGFVCDTEDELVAAANRVGLLDRRACRGMAEARFSAEIMAKKYERVYERLLAARALRFHSLPALQPVASGSVAVDPSRNGRSATPVLQSG